MIFGVKALSCTRAAGGLLLCAALACPTVARAADVLLVDDDDNRPDVQSFYTEALRTLGVSFDLRDVSRGAGEPSAASMRDYRAVFWFTGADGNRPIGGTAGPSPKAEDALTDYLRKGGCFFISSQGYHTDRGLSSDFMAKFLGVASARDDTVRPRSVQGEIGFDGRGPYVLEFPFEDAIDELIPEANADVAFSAKPDGESVAISVDANKSDGFRTTFWGFPFEAIDGQLARQDAMDGVLSYCGVEANSPPGLPDSFEDDDTPDQAKVILLSNINNKAIQARNFDNPKDEDWIKFTASPGITFVLEIVSAVEKVDLQLFDNKDQPVNRATVDRPVDGVTTLTWKADRFGVFLIRGTGNFTPLQGTTPPVGGIPPPVGGISLPIGGSSPLAGGGGLQNQITMPVLQISAAPDETDPSYTAELRVEDPRFNGFLQGFVRDSDGGAPVPEATVQIANVLEPQNHPPPTVIALTSNTPPEGRYRLLYQEGALTDLAFDKTAYQTTMKHNVTFVFPGPESSEASEVNACMVPEGMVDTDGDCDLDSADLDDDNDGVPDTSDAFPEDAAASVDSDRDGMPNDFNAGATQAQKDASGLVVDDDDDNDGISDVDEVEAGTNPLVNEKSVVIVIIQLLLED